MNLLPRIQNALKNEDIREKVKADFEHTIAKIAGTDKDISSLVSQMFTLLLQDKEQGVIEKEVYTLLSNTKHEGASLTKRFKNAFSNRTEKVFNQIKEYCQDVTGGVIDYGCGNAVLAQILHDRLGLDIRGFDVRVYKADDVTVPVAQFDGYRIPCPDNYFEMAVVTNVIHHEVANEEIVKELTRLVSRRLVIIETVPVGDSPDELRVNYEKTFMNDYLTNRLFQNSDIPTPGTYETPEGWIGRFEKHGWTVTHSESLGVDQPIIRDTHHLLIFDKE
jgi:SAM-dependent methyltransferase